jgi:hypothetical protein
MSDESQRELDIARRARCASPLQRYPYQTTLGSTTLVFTFVGGAFTLSAKVASPTVAETVLTAY